MNAWPRIANDRILRRFAMSDAEFIALAERLADRIDPVPFAEEHFERAIAYPWHEPPSEGSFLLVDGRVSRLPVGQATGAVGGRLRHALVAIGSNADPVTLATKLADMDALDDRTVVGIHGSLIDLEIGHSPHLAVYGALPATLYRRAGVRTRATLLMVTTEQLAVLSRSEFNYLLARLPAEQFVSPAEHASHSQIYAYISRHGVIADETGEPIPLHRPDQRLLLDRAAKLTIGPSADARDLVRRTIESYPWAVRDARPRLTGLAQPLDRTAWDLHPGE